DIAEMITPAPLTVTGITANNKVYDATTKATLSTSSAALVGVFAGDTVALDTSAATGTFASKDVGNGIAVKVSGLALSGPQAGDYSLSQVRGGGFSTQMVAGGYKLSQGKNLSIENAFAGT